MADKLNTIREQMITKLTALSDMCRSKEHPVAACRQFAIDNEIGLGSLDVEKANKKTIGGACKTKIAEIQALIDTHADEAEKRRKQDEAAAEKRQERVKQAIEIGTKMAGAESAHIDTDEEIGEEIDQYMAHVRQESGIIGSLAHSFMRHALIERSNDTTWPTLAVLKARVEETNKSKRGIPYRRVLLALSPAYKDAVERVHKIEGAPGVASDHGMLGTLAPLSKDVRAKDVEKRIGNAAEEHKEMVRDLFAELETTKQEIGRVNKIGERAIAVAYALLREGKRPEHIEILRNGSIKIANETGERSRGKIKELVELGTMSAAQYKAAMDTAETRDEENKGSGDADTGTEGSDDASKTKSVTEQAAALGSNVKAEVIHRAKTPEIALGLLNRLNKAANAIDAGEPLNKAFGESVGNGDEVWEELRNLHALLGRMLTLHDQASAGSADKAANA